MNYQAELIKALVELERELDGVADETHGKVLWALQMARSVVFGPVACPECKAGHGEICRVDGAVDRWDHKARVTPFMPAPRPGLQKLK